MKEKKNNKMKHLIVAILLLASHFQIRAQEASDKIIGVWLNDEANSKIEIYKTGNTYSGKIIWIAQLENNPELNPKDTKNPDPGKRNQPILGMDIITGLKYLNGKWVNGEIYTPKRGVYADCEVELSITKQLKIFVSKGMFTRTKTWIRE